jgi:hypothetical protein
MNKIIKSECQLTGTDGNVFAIIGKVSKALVKAGMRERADEFKKKAMSQKSYDDVLILLHEYVDAL